MNNPLYKRDYIIIKKVTSHNSLGIKRGSQSIYVTPISHKFSPYTKFSNSVRLYCECYQVRSNEPVFIKS